MALVSVKMYGAAAMARNMKKVKKRASAAMEVGLYRMGVGIIKDAQSKVPVDTGNLKASGYVRIVREGSGIIDLGFVGDDSKKLDYAIVQHEDTSLNHPKGGEAKFLEKAVIAASRAKTRLAADVRMAFKMNKSRPAKEIQSRPGKS